MLTRKIFNGILLAIVAIVLTGCDGSKEIQGKWYASNSNNKEIIINIASDLISFSAEGEQDWQVPYEQIGTGFKNNTSYKLIKFDQKTFSFVFPDKNNKENAMILLPDNKNNATVGTVYWVLSKNEFPVYKSQQ